MRLAGALRLRDGRAEPAASPRPVPASAQALTVRAVHPDGRRLERTVPPGASDAVLRALLADGWHVEELRR